MYDAGKIVSGLVLFAGLASFPIWYTAGSGAAKEPLKLKLPAGETRCVESKELMKSSHMELLDQWRDSVVRDGNRLYTASSGEQYEMSLTNTCMGCHAEKAEFCDRCHDYTAVADPYCWDCHVVPEKGAKAAAAAPREPMAVVEPAPAADPMAAVEPAPAADPIAPVEPAPAIAPAAGEQTAADKGNE